MLPKGYTKEILEEMPIGVLLEDKKGKVIYVNKLLSTMTGMPVSNLKGKILKKIIDNPTTPFIRFKTGRHKYSKWLLVSNKKMNNFSLNTYFDINDLKEELEKQRGIQLHLVKSKEKFKTVFEAALDGMILVDSDTSIFDANDAACEMFSMTRYELINQKVSNLPIENKRRFKKDWDNFFKNRSKRGEIEIIKDDRSRVIEYVVTAEILPLRHLLVLRDITDRKIEEKRSEHFLGIASHELKSPIASIKAYTEIIKRLSPEPKVKTLLYLTKLDERTDALTALINDLLDVTRIRRNRLEFFHETFDIDELVEKVISDVQVGTPSHKITREGNVKTKVFADKSRIIQVLTNLIRNAVKYSPGKDKVLITTKTIQKNIVISIRDYGVGISGKNQKKIFDLYFRGNDSKVMNIQGLGVGLYIVSEVVKQHGGKIWVRSKIGKGSTFFFTLPTK